MRELFVPQLGERVPRRGGATSAWLGRAILRVMGWQLGGSAPNVPKAVVIFVPHTSNWDWILCMAALFALRLDASWMGKHTIFRPPLGGVMRRLGGIPIRRSESHGIVEQIAQEFAQREHLILGISPEGTRKHVASWKTGFYYIALQANVPIVTVYIDYPSRTLGFGKVLQPTGQIDADIAELKRFFSPYRGRH